jgi:hypothetical protein
VLLAETLRSSTLKLALLAIGLFGTVTFALVGYLYWSTVSYVRNRSDPAIAAEQIALKETFERAGRDGLVATISQPYGQKIETITGSGDCQGHGVASGVVLRYC